MRSMEAIILGATDCTGLTVAIGLLGVMEGTWLGDCGPLGCLGAAKKLVMDCCAFSFLALDIVAQADVYSHELSETKGI